MILVTGGTGLVGSHLLYQLSLENDTIRAVFRKNSNLEAVKNVFSYFSDDFEDLFKKIEWVEADITDVVALEKAFKNITEVYHSAALVSFNPKDYHKMRKINIEGTANIVNLSIENAIKKFCFVSSVAAVGKSLNADFVTETNEWDIEKSNYGYAITKYGAEIEVWRASQEGVPVVIVNPGVIIGAGFWNTGSGKIFSKIYKKFNFYTKGITGYVSVNDVVKAMLLLMKSEVQNERFILVAENKSYREIFNEIALKFNKKKPAIKITTFMSEIGWRFEKIKSYLTNKPPLLTKHSSKSIHQKRYFSSEKIKNTLDFKFEPISKSIHTICKLYLKDI
ncbi:MULTISPECIES: NAD-dependent epimerase/dehydratase family protein [Flavobacteriaceae]|uniref:NAD-dependent epimerase/dehydratase family protein n=2 Tax=Flavobacteriaceae TaxID=49546 RepID=A0A4Y8ASA2_9FLAO|nr:MULTISPECIES: NAD-dependent epimerase/dehydratase family protein [Flavobacteriaceae]TEW74071.1 NAD-dependent epimerase/dehydratase family protein [Gramella jeungdoensis]GGK39998.1 NAD-dependent epimerase [Lutibacter litoralis]